MSKNVPIIRQVAWIALIPQFLFMGVLFLIFYFLNLKEPIIITAITYLIISYSVRGFFTKEHRKGMRLSNEGKFVEAINSYKNSVSFFERNKWLDDYRYLTLLSASKISYREMGMINIAFSYSQIDEGMDAKKMYEKTLQQFPQSIFAKSALNMINSSKNLN